MMLFVYDCMMFVGSGSLAAMSIFESRYKNDISVSYLLLLSQLTMHCKFSSFCPDIVIIL